MNAFAPAPSNPSAAPETLRLAHGLEFADLYRREGLLRLDAAFLAVLETADAVLAVQYAAARTNPDAMGPKEESALMLAVAPHLEAFLVALFGVAPEAEALVMAHRALDPLYAAKRLFVQRRAVKAHPPALAATFDGTALRAAVETALGAPFDEPAFARAALAAMEAESETTEDAMRLDAYLRFAAWAVATQHFGRESILFTTPKKLDFAHLVETRPADRRCEHPSPAPEDQGSSTLTAHALAPEDQGSSTLTAHALAPEDQGFSTLTAHALAHEGARRVREGFALTDARGTLARALDEANYCIYCHHQGRDSCSKGFRDAAPKLAATAAANEELTTPHVERAFKVNPLGIPLNGCPLEEHISEMHELKAQALPLAALAMVTVANPMCAGTGHRICNDCMKACVYQKQEPVNIPLAETRVLDDVLGLPWGFEIYALLTRWNPLNLRRPLPLAASGRRVLVAGLGPAGFTLAHHLMNDGHTVVAVEGLKLEPLPPGLCGVAMSGVGAAGGAGRVAFAPIRAVGDVWEALEARAGGGFGGVAEYGITVRWDKNFLTLLRLLIERRAEATLIGGVRFGSTLTPEQAWAMGFDHIALCMGAGSPTLIEMENVLARGVRTASDFLMNLQLAGAGRMDSLANLQIRLPIAVVGGGLTAVDTTTESLAYYPVQVEKFLRRYETLTARQGEAAVQARWSAEDREVAEEFMAHARALRAERAQAAREGRTPDIHRLLDGWGGATLIYRKRLIDAPSYRLNHEEVEKALEEGIFFAELWEPQGVVLDAHGAARALRLRQAGGTAEKILPARTILMAAGTSPNTLLAREHPESAMLHGQYFQAVDERGLPATPARNAKPDVPRVLMHRRADGRAMSFFGDLHPSFAGNVVKAMGSAKQGYPTISRMLAELPAPLPKDATGSDALRDRLSARVHAVHRLTPTIVELVLRAPLAAENFRPGQFYRLQNFEAYARRVEGTVPTRLAMEPLAMTGAWVDAAAGLIGVIALEMGGSSDLCAQLAVGEPVVLMGPTGTPTQIPERSTLLLAGGGLGNAVLFSIGQAARAKGTRVLYFAGYKARADRYKIEQIEAAADVIVWCCDEAPGFAPTRPQDKSFVGNIVEAMRAYGAGKLGTGESGTGELGTGELGQTEPGGGAIALREASHAVVIGSDRMMAAVAAARHGVLKPYLNPAHKAVGSINSPMQCMLKEVCGACLQRQVDATSGEVRYVYSCFDQDQDLDAVDFHFLNARLHQNSLSEKLTARWLDALLAEEELRPSRMPHSRVA